MSVSRRDGGWLKGTTTLALALASAESAELPVPDAMLTPLKSELSSATVSLSLFELSWFEALLLPADASELEEAAAPPICWPATETRPELELRFRCKEFVLLLLMIFGLETLLLGVEAELGMGLELEAAAGYFFKILLSLRLRSAPAPRPARKNIWMRICIIDNQRKKSFL